MDNLECLLNGWKTPNAKCVVPEECRHCGFEHHEANQRKLKIMLYGLTKHDDGLRGLLIQR